MKKLIVSIISMILLLSLSTIPASAHTLSSGGDSYCKFKFLSSKGHLSKKSTTYKFSSTTVKNKYKADFADGIALWGSNITMSESSSSAYIISEVNNPNNGVLATTYTTTVGTVITEWSMKINKPEYNSFGIVGKKVIAHEIGHAYGLGHFDGNSSIMKAVHPLLGIGWGVQTEDIWGIKNCTHAHSTHTSTLYTPPQEGSSTSSCQVRCKDCKIQTGSLSHTWGAVSGGVKTCTRCKFSLRV